MRWLVTPASTRSATVHKLNDHPSEKNNSTFGFPVEIPDKKSRTPIEHFEFQVAQASRKQVDRQSQTCSPRGKIAWHIQALKENGHPEAIPVIRVILIGRGCR